MFITFEGLDSSGKSTQAVRLIDRLEKEGHSALLLREPGGTAVSERIREILLDKKHSAMSIKAELFLFCAARTQLVAEVVKPALAAGTIVISDRFIDSTTAYQGFGRGLDRGEVDALNTIAIDGTTPDLTLFIDVEMTEIAKRRSAAGLSSDRMEASGELFYRRVRDGYLAIAEQFPDRIRTIDGMQPVETIHEIIWSLVSPRIAPIRS